MTDTETLTVRKTEFAREKQRGKNQSEQEGMGRKAPWVGV